MARKPNRRSVLKDLASKFSKAMLQELLAQRTYQDSQVRIRGARTPTPDDLAIVQRARESWLSASRQRLLVLAEMEDLLGIIHKPGKSARDVLDDMGDL